MFFYSIIIPSIGILIILVSSVIFTYSMRRGSSKIKEFFYKIQKINMFGINLEVTFFTLFIVIGASFSGSGIYIFLKNYENQVSILQEEVKRKVSEINSIKKRNVNILLKPEGMNENSVSDIDYLVCEYWLAGADNPKKAKVYKGYDSNSFRVTLQDITSSTYIQKLLLKDLNKNKSWFVKEKFSPMEPILPMLKRRP